jgi:hypothetical protein
MVKETNQKTIMNELSLKLKDSLVTALTRNPHNLDTPYLIKGDKTYTRSELAAEIKAETPEGIEQLTNILRLALDIMTRKPTIN